MNTALTEINNEMIEIKATIAGWNNRWMHIMPNKAYCKEEEDKIKVIALLAEYTYDHSQLYYAAVINKGSNRAYAHKLSLVYEDGQCEDLSKLTWFHWPLVDEHNMGSLQRRFNPMR